MHGWYNEDFGYHGLHRNFGPRWYRGEFFGEPTAEDRKRYLEEWKRHLEYMLKEVEIRLADLDKTEK